jgi:hypothetical protein
MASASGVTRPMNLMDVLNAIYDAAGTNNLPLSNGTVQPVGTLVEANETMTSADTGFVITSAPVGWDQGVWGSFVWH